MHIKRTKSMKKYNELSNTNMMNAQ